MKPTQVLIAEHEVILKAVTAIFGAGQRLREGEDVPASFFFEAIDFVRQYADARHHGKEEVVFFPALEALGMPKDAGPIGVMLVEHGIGRQAIAEMESAAERYKAGDDAARTQLASACRAWAELLAAHIEKENNILFVMADQMLDAESTQRLEAQFEEVDARSEFADRRAQFERWAADVAARYGAGVSV